MAPGLAGDIHGGWPLTVYLDKYFY